MLLSTSLNCLPNRGRPCASPFLRPLKDWGTFSLPKSGQTVAAG